MFFTTYLPLIFGLNVPFLRSLFVIRSSARAARTVICSSFVRHLFVHCSFIVRLLFVFCSSFVRSLFVFCSFFVRSLFVLCSFFVRLFSICLCGLHRHLFVVPSSHFSVTTLPLLGRGLGRGYFVHLPVQLAPACRATTSHFTFYLLPSIIGIPPVLLALWFSEELPPPLSCNQTNV